MVITGIICIMYWCHLLSISPAFCFCVVLLWCYARGGTICAPLTGWDKHQLKEKEQWILFCYYGANSSAWSVLKRFILLLGQTLCFTAVMCSSELRYGVFCSQGVCQLEYLGSALSDYWYFLWQGFECYELQVSVRYARARLLRYKLPTNYMVTVHIFILTCKDSKTRDKP